ncbi:MAG: ATP--guanido phosphotransferase [Phycisphaerales bacterium]
MSHQPPSGFTAAAVRRGADWLSGVGADADVVVSSRVRLARNLAGFPFLTRASRQHRQAILDICRDRLLNAGLAQRMLWVDVHASPTLDRTLMVERHLISKEHARGRAAAQNAHGRPPVPEDDPRGVAISLPDESLSIMVNEEDHLRLQSLRSGLELSAAFDHINRVDDLIEGECSAGTHSLDYAYSPRFGFLTSCPTNVGTGIRLSVMVHLPALKLAGEMDRVRRAMMDLALAVRGYYGEGSEAAGEFFQISNQTTLGKSEQEILDQFERKIIPDLIKAERLARKHLLDKRRRLLEDKVCRSLGTLRHARLLTPEESLTLLSDVRFGIMTGLITDVSESAVNQLILLTQPAHLQRLLGRDLDQGQRREARADLVRERLSR